MDDQEPKPEDVDAEPAYEAGECDNPECPIGCPEDHATDYGDSLGDDPPPSFGDEPLSPVVEAALRARGAPIPAKRTPAKAPAKPLKKPNKASEYEVMQRRRDVFRLRMRGHSYKEIAEKLEISIPTVRNDLAAMREEQEKQVKGFRQDHFVGEAMIVFDDVMQHAWQEFNACQIGSKQRIAALDLVRTTMGDKLKALADVGLVQKAPQEVKHTHVHSLPWDEKVQEKVIESMLDVALTPQLALPSPDPHHGPGKNIEEGEIVVQETAVDPLAAEKAQAREEQVLRSMVAHGLSPEEAQAVIDKAKHPKKDGES